MHKQLLPVRPEPHEGEELGFFVQRLAEANHVSVVEVSGLHPWEVRWLWPHEALLEHLSSVTGISPEELRRHSTAKVTGVRPTSPRSLSARLRQVREWCPTCGLRDSVWGRLRCTVLCPACGGLLTDRNDQPTWEPPRFLQDVQVRVRDLVQVSRRGGRQSFRFDSLMNALPAAITEDWPSPYDGEPVSWRRWTAEYERNRPRRGAGARPPAVTATLMALAWEPSLTEQATQEVIEQAWLNRDRWRIAGQEPSDEPGLTDLIEHVGQLGLLPCHVPSLIRHDGEDLEVCLHRANLSRTVQALLLIWATARAQGWRWTYQNAADHCGMYLGVRRRDLMQRMSQDPALIRELMATAQELHTRGTEDLTKNRLALGWAPPGSGCFAASAPPTVSSAVLSTLPAEARKFEDAARLATAWVWLDATQGGLAGGPFEDVAPIPMVYFDHALNPEGRLQLRAWWTERIRGAADDLLRTSATAPLTPSQAVDADAV